MQGRFQPTDSGFIFEGEVIEAPHGASPRSLLDALKGYQGRRVRITVEVVERRPVDTLREVLERFRLESEAPEESPQPG